MGDSSITAQPLFTRGEPIRRARLHDQVVRSLALRILQEGSGGDGSTLPTEVELTRQLNVSRTVLREAVKVLASKGLVEVGPKRGMRVRPRSAWNLLDPDLLAWQYEAGPDEQFYTNLFEVRSIIEIAAARRAAERATAADRAEIEAAFGQMAATVEQPDAHIAADLRFHAGIVDACHNYLLSAMNATIGTALRASRLITIQVSGGAAASIPAHRAIADGIGAHDPTAAGTAMERLLAEAERDLTNVLHRSGSTT